MGVDMGRCDGVAVGGMEGCGVVGARRFSDGFVDEPFAEPGRDLPSLFADAYGACVLAGEYGRRCRGRLGACAGRSPRHSGDSLVVVVGQPLLDCADGRVALVRSSAVAPLAIVVTEVVSF